MKGIVWYMFRPDGPDEDRRYAQTYAPSPERAKMWRDQGYRIVEVTFGLPPNMSPADHDAKGRVKGRSE